MTSMLATVRTFVIAAALTLSAASASPQSAGAPQGHEHENHAKAVQSATGTTEMPTNLARIAVLDEHIRTLASDMHMFTGELKVETMAALLTALVERQSLMSPDIARMHEWMMRPMMERAAPAPAPDEEPGALCLPAP